MLLHNPFQSSRALFWFSSTIDENKKWFSLQEDLISCKYFADTIHFIEEFVF